MLTLVIGPNGSGKSLFAESLVARTTGRRVYVATMMAQTGDNHRRVEKHRRQREGLGFLTLEEPFALNGLDIQEEDVVLLEDMTNLLGNVLFVKNGTAASVLADILALAKRCRHLIVVTIGGLSPKGYQGETADYIRAIEELNEALTREAHVVVEMDRGKPRSRKGDWHALT